MSLSVTASSYSASLTRTGTSTSRSSAYSTNSSSQTQNSSKAGHNTGAKSEDASVTRLKAAAENYLKTLNIISQITQSKGNGEETDLSSIIFGLGTTEATPSNGVNDSADKLAKSIVYGSAGGDRINVSGQSQVYGGSGGDSIIAYGQSQIDAGDGDDYINTEGQSQIDVGDGDDIIITYGQAQINGGAGFDIINANGQSQIDGGAGNDLINSQGQSIINGGTGNDIIRVYGQSIVNGGAGNDTIAIDGSDTTVIFAKGGGHDNASLQGNITIQIGAEFSKDDLQVSEFGRYTQISFAGSDEKFDLVAGKDNLTATLRFADGQSLDVSLAIDYEEIKQLSVGRNLHKGSLETLTTAYIPFHKVV